MLKTPKFWTRRNLLSLIFLPFSFCYFIGFFLASFFSKKEKISKPVICIGNIIAGGAGKTPCAIAVGRVLREMDVNFAFLSRGYMNDGSKFIMLRNEENYKAEQVGDEPLLLTKIAPTFVAKNRIFGARQIESMNKFRAVLLDDGMQNNSLHRDFTIMVLDGNIGLGNGFMIPAGPMREPLCLGLKKVDLIVTIGEVAPKLLQKFSNKKIVKAIIAPLNLEDFFEKKLIAFCGLAYPEKFFSLLEKKGLDVIETHAFADHYKYQIHELENFHQMAKEKNATLVTTKKDWVKFPKLFQDKISYLDVELQFEDKELLISELKKIL